jgi:acyl-CoA reductase-like NAD-dependent aldehyde dehydrogenase
MGEKLKSDAEGRLSAVATEKVIAGVASRLEDQIAMANMAARNHAEKWAAEQKRQRIENIFRHSADYWGFRRIVIGDSGTIVITIPG